MKIGNMEGTPEEIEGFCEVNSIDIARYLELPETPLKPIWLLAPVGCVLAAIACLILAKPTSDSLQTFVFLVGCGAGIWLAVSVQIRFKNTCAAGFVAVGTVLIMLVAFGVIAPREMIQHLKELRE